MLPTPGGNPREAKLKRPLIVAAIAVSTLVPLAACGGKATDGGESTTGTLAGTITIGPACPVEPCSQPAEAIYVGRELKLLRSGVGLISVPLREDGSFSVSLTPAAYQIRLDACNFLGCAEAFPVERTITAGETVVLNVDLDTGIRSAERPSDFALLVSDLVGLGAPVGQGGAVSQPFFSVEGQEIIVDREAVQVFSYASPEAAQADADLVDETGSGVGTSMVTWIAPPHFYLRDSLLVLYVGDNSGVTGRLEEVLGPQFAGASKTLARPTGDPQTSSEPTTLEAAEAVKEFEALLTVADVEAYLAAGVSLNSTVRDLLAPARQRSSRARRTLVIPAIDSHRVLW